MGGSLLRDLSRRSEIEGFDSLEEERDETSGVPHVIAVGVAEGGEEATGVKRMANETVKAGLNDGLPGWIAT